MSGTKVLCALALTVALLSAGCAKRYVNSPIEEYKPWTGTAQGKITRKNSSTMLLVLAFSGGGTRAAAFSYGVLEALRDTTVDWDGGKRRLSDEVDLISAVSGGSFTAAYYGLFGEKIFTDYVEEFLKKDVERDLMVRLFAPLTLIKLMSPNYNRADMAADYYNRYIFKGGTYSDIAQSGGPLITINATDLTFGYRFPFTRTQFDSICSDFANFPVARAVAASSAVPLVFNAITLKNHAGACGYKLREQIKEVLEKNKVTSRQYQLAKKASIYQDSVKAPYIHLLDGGLADNLGLRSLIQDVVLLQNAWEVLKRSGLTGTRKIVIVTVNAENASSITISQRAVPRITDIISAAGNLVISRYNFETMDLMRTSMKKWAKAIRVDRCKEMPGPGCDDFESYLVEVNFSSLPDEKLRNKLQQLPTSFYLPSNVIDELRETAKWLLMNSPEFKRLIEDLR